MPNQTWTWPNQTQVVDLLVERGEDHDNEVPGQQDVAVLPEQFPVVGVSLDLHKLQYLLY